MQACSLPARRIYPAGETEMVFDSQSMVFYTQVSGGQIIDVSITNPSRSEDFVVSMAWDNCDRSPSFVQPSTNRYEFRTRLDNCMALSESNRKAFIILKKRSDAANAESNSVFSISATSSGCGACRSITCPSNSMCENGSCICKPGFESSPGGELCIPEDYQTKRRNIASLKEYSKQHGSGITNLKVTQSSIPKGTIVLTWEDDTERQDVHLGYLLRVKELSTQKALFSDLFIPSSSRVYPVDIAPFVIGLEYVFRLQDSSYISVPNDVQSMSTESSNSTFSSAASIVWQHLARDVSLQTTPDPSNNLSATLAFSSSDGVIRVVVNYTSLYSQLPADTLLTASIEQNLIHGIEVQEIYPPFHAGDHYADLAFSIRVGNFDGLRISDPIAISLETLATIDGSQQLRLKVLDADSRLWIDPSTICTATFSPASLTHSCLLGTFAVVKESDVNRSDEMDEERIGLATIAGCSLAVAIGIAGVVWYRKRLAKDAEQKKNIDDMGIYTPQVDSISDNVVSV
eukprot:TRINITY_DN3187_c0_g1_i2.p1 TRINITY_DN3187_c0_g1~~TRINITY_DN3187_c0_g1_i2.p1  ORF type:complete len:516 (-),score=98.25 TRINITY_DN3187_c0_g1_i2:80-1627(-)